MSIDYNKFLQNHSLDDSFNSAPYINTRPTFLTRFKDVYTKKINKKNLLAWSHQWRWAIFFSLFSIVSGALMYCYRKEFFQALETLSLRLRDMGFGGYVLISLLIFMSAFPPIFGYSTCQTLSGYTFGFAIGFPISYLSGLLGASVCFWMSRTCLQTRVTRILSDYPNIEAAVRAVEKKGFKLFLLIRISPYPFNLLNFLSAASNIPFSHFVAATAISLLKISIHVYIGANLTSFVKHILGEEEENMSEGEMHAERVKLIALIFGSLLSFGVMAYLYKITKSAIQEVNSLEEEEMQGFLSQPLDDEDSVHSVNN